MRICFDTQSTLGQKTGIGHYTAHLLDALRRVAPEHEYVTFDWGREVRMRLDRRLRWQQWEVPRRAARAGCDLLHVPGFDAPRWRPCPVVLTVHDLIGMLFPQNFPPVSRFYWSRWLPWSVRRAEHIIVDAEHTRRDLQRLLGIPEERVTVIPLGVEARFMPLAEGGHLSGVRERYHLPQPFILYVGTLEPRKGLDTLVAAYAAIAGEVPHDLVLGGGLGWYTEALFAQIQTAGVAERVHAIGYVADADMPALFNLADLFIFPSRYEGFGLPPLEAMACGTPVITSNASTLPEVVGGAAVTLPPDDAPALAVEMSRLLGDPAARAELRARGLARAAEFTWERTARRTLDVYQAVLA